MMINNKIISLIKHTETEIYQNTGEEKQNNDANELDQEDKFTETLRMRKSKLH